MQVEDFERAVSALFAQGSAAVNPATRCEAEQYLRGISPPVAYAAADSCRYRVMFVVCILRSGSGCISSPVHSQSSAPAFLVRSTSAAVDACGAAVCGSSSGSVLLLSALQSRCSFETKFFALQQLLQLLPEQQQQARQHTKDVLFAEMRLRVCSEQAWACSNSGAGGEAFSEASALATAAADPAASPDAAAVHNKLALLVTRLLAADVDLLASGGANATSKGREAFWPMRELLHQEICALSVHLQKAGEASAAVAAATAIAQRCDSCVKSACAAAAGHSLAATLESLRVALRVLLVLHQEFLEDLPASPVSEGIRFEVLPYTESLRV